MILNELLQILDNDNELKQLITGVYAFGTDKLNSIVYEYVDLVSNKIIGQARLTLTILTDKKDYQKNLQIHNMVKQLLLTFGDNKLNNNIIEIVLNGGGILENEETETIHNKAIFTIKYREGKN